METNQGLLQAQIKVKNTIDLNNAFSSPSVANPQLKSIEGELNLSNEYALQSFNSSNTNTQHIDTIRTNSSNTSLKEALNNLPNLQYVRLEGSYESKGNSFDNNTNLQKVDLSESLQVKPEDFKANESLKTLPNLDYSNPDLTDIITNDTNLLPTTFDISNEPNTNKLGVHGDSTHQLGNLEFVKVNPEAPFDNQITPQINTRYTSLDRNGLVNLFNTMPYNMGYTVVGSPTIVDGVVSGFSNGNYVTLSQNPTQDLSNFEIQTTFTMSSAVALQYEDILRIRKTSNEYNNFYLYAWPNTGRFRFYAAFEDYTNQAEPSRTNIELGGTVEPGLNYTYYIKVISNGNSLTAILYNKTLGIEVDRKTSDGVFKIPKDSVFYFGTSSGAARYFSGSIDLNETYIKVNSQVSTGPVGYTVVGSPTIVDGVVSRFSSSDYIRTNSNVPSNFPKEITATFNWTSYNNDGRHVVGWNNGNVSVSGSHYITIAGFDTEGNYSSFSGSTYLDYNTWYTIKVLMETNKTSVYLKSGNDWVLDFSANVGFVIPDRKITFGHSSSSDFFQGSIDLNETYIKVNGKLWFGHESKQVTWFNGKPSQIKVVDVSGATGTSSLTNDDKAIVTKKGWSLVTDGSNSKNYIIEDGKLVWADPNIYLQSSGTQYIDTGVRNYGYTSKTQVSYTQIGPNRQLIGNEVVGFWGINESGYFEVYQESSKLAQVGVKYEVQFNVSEDDSYSYRNLSVDGQSLIVNQRSATKPNGGRILIFSIPRESSKYMCYCKLYSQLIWNAQGALVRNFVPVPTGLVIGNFTVPSNGMFDIVNQQFYPNAGTGQFTYGWDLE